MGDLSRLLSRNAADLTGADLWLDLPADAPLGELDVREAVLAVDDFAACRAFRAAGVDAVHGYDAGEARALSQIVLCQPREKDRLSMLARLCAHRMASDGVLWLAGENRGGARSAGRRLETCFDRVEKADSARHCTLWTARDPRPERAFHLDDHRRCLEIQVQIGGKSLSLAVHSWPGVFAGGGLDPGTELLLQALPPPRAHQRVLDFACGAGIIGAALARLQPHITLDALDSSALACRSTRATLEANSIQANVFASDGFSEVRASYDWVVSNPPFHRGHRADTGLAPGLLRAAGRFLAPGGRLVLVANRHLPYARWLRETFGHFETLAANQGYQVYLAQR